MQGPPPTQQPTPEQKYNGMIEKLLSCEEYKKSTEDDRREKIGEAIYSHIA